MSRKPNIICEGTRYHKVCINKEGNMLMCVVSTPLTKDELFSFIDHRMGYIPTVQVCECPLNEVENDLYGKIIGLSTFEGLLEPFVPEEILEEKVTTLVRTNKTHGDFILKKEEEKEA